ncbi:hypothetical protein OG21DRAFT_1495807, partial [Imleria badia]
MSEHLQDSLRLRALNCLKALQEDLDGIEETEEDLKLHIISDHVLMLKNILKGAKKVPESVPFKMVTEEDLEKVGVTRKQLDFEPVKVTKLMDALSESAENEIADLHAQIKKIYAHVNMKYESCSHMIIEAILLTLAELASTQTRGIVILPEMKITQGDGVCISHPVSGYELWLSGNVDYMVIEYQDVKDYR